MSSFTVKMMAGSLPPVTGSNFHASPADSVTLKRPTLPLQVRVKELEKLEEAHEITSKNISRRDLALFLTAASFTAVTLSSPKPAEARISKSEMKKMILEKLKILREKVGLLKPETKEGEKFASPSPSRAEKETTPSSPAPSIAGEKTYVPPVAPPLPNIQNDKKIVVEAATLP